MDLFTCKKSLFIVLFIIVGELQHYISTQTFRNRQFFDPYAVLLDDALSSFLEKKFSSFVTYRGKCIFPVYVHFCNW